MSDQPIKPDKIQPESYIDMSVDNLNLNAGIINALKDSNLDTIWKVVFRIDGLHAIRGVGPKKIDVIKEALREKGIYLDTFYAEAIESIKNSKSKRERASKVLDFLMTVVGSQSKEYSNPSVWLVSIVQDPDIVNDKTLFNIAISLLQKQLLNLQGYAEKPSMEVESKNGLIKEFFSAKYYYKHY